MFKNNKDKDRIVRELFDAHEDIVGAVIISDEGFPDTDTDDIGKFYQDEEIGNIAAKIINVASLKQPERIWFEYPNFDLFVICYAKDWFLLVKAKKTKQLATLRNAIKKTSEKIQSLVDPNPASGNGDHPRQNNNEKRYRGKQESPES
ncbi:hypothetical protein [Moorena sp. SIO3I6]|uniref:hypothetical protein n=1 Tax=Moorena sp. SIO3I6 TaxID=2607831 RepID=UPI0013FBFD9C|nr:hypothetical protein [Moorena sp. SIO3I6]NEP28470.1 hypothetical protein [Moorena sp. SIO3I6]